MTTEEKQLLLKDLCARLPYFENWVQYEGKDYIVTGYGHGRVSLLPSIFSSIVGPCPLVEEVKPYLRPMSAMTEEEKGEINAIIREFGNKWFEADDPEGQWNATFWEISEISDYLNSRFLDYRGLIPMGLALEAKEGMYKTE